MPNYMLHEMPDMTRTGKKKIYPKLKTVSLLSEEQLLEKMLKIGFDVRYLADALRVIETEEVVMELTNSLSPIVFTSPDEKYDYSYMVLPVRINN